MKQTRNICQIKMIEHNMKENQFKKNWKQIIGNQFRVAQNKAIQKNTLQF